MKPFDSRNVFDLTHEHKLTCRMGKCVPIMCLEALPGDTFKDTTQIVLRLSPMLAPIMHRVDVFTHFFFVPNRLIMDDWEKFITGGFDGKDTTPVPQIVSPAETGWSVGSLADYLGLPTGVPELPCLALPFRAYDLIWNEYYRDENLQDEIVINKGNGVDTTTSVELMSRNWEFDYFTGALPFAQRGDPVYLPLGLQAPVVGDGSAFQLGTDPQGSNMTTFSGNLSGDQQTWVDFTNKSATGKTFYAPLGGSSNKTGLITDLSLATAATVNEVRTAFQVQKCLEKNARAGVRYVEWLWSHFHENAGDARLQRPEYLGGGRSPIVISEVLQTSATDATSPQANMAGHGISVQQTHQFKKHFSEHGYVIGIMSIMPRTAYFQGQHRMWNRETKYDWYLPVFAHLGEQAVLNQEIYAQKPGAVGFDQNKKTFGFTPRYQEYRKIPSTVHGEFRSTLDFWHLARKFDSLPALNGEFVACNASMRPFAVTDEDNCWVQVGHILKAIRPIPKYGNPGFIDHG